MPNLSYLKPAEWVFLCELHGGNVVAEIPFACAPKGLQLVPFGQNSVAVIAQERGCRKGVYCADQLVGLRRGLSRLAEKASER